MKSVTSARINPFPLRSLAGCQVAQAPSPSIHPCGLRQSLDVGKGQLHHCALQSWYKTFPRNNSRTMARRSYLSPIPVPAGILSVPDVQIDPKQQYQGSSWVLLTSAAHLKGWVRHENLTRARRSYLSPIRSLQESYPVTDGTGQTPAAVPNFCENKKSSQKSISHDGS